MVNTVASPVEAGALEDAVLRLTENGALAFESSLSRCLVSGVRRT